jgi:chromosome segregation ATPase
LDKAISPEGITESEWPSVELAASTATIRDLQAGNETLSTSVDVLLTTTQDLNATIHAKNEHIAHMEDTIAQLEAELASKQTALDAQAALLRRIESGRLMRLVNRLALRRTTDDGRRTMDDADSKSKAPHYRPSSIVHRPSSASPPTDP